ncbi:MAG TPA: Holliday junction branch migration protein RuvA [Gemmatimonadaceae bacterium]|jgi:holliday junction DNA helicase RuvA|nr:Holliday junction branch migration protein RuvA [Gemmatimonadaceae bacterium]
MIAQVSGTLVARDLDRVEVMTAGGVAYELTIPLGTYEQLPRLGDPVTLQTHVVVRDDAWMLFGFTNVHEKRVFQRLLTANGVGPALAIGMLSALSAERLVRAIQEKDLATLQGVPRVGRKKAERLVLDLADKLDDVMLASDGAARPASAAVDDAMRALVSLGYNSGDADKAVRRVVEADGRGLTAPEIIRAALARMSG